MREQRLQRAHPRAQVPPGVRVANTGRGSIRVAAVSVTTRSRKQPGCMPDSSGLGVLFGGEGPLLFLMCSRIARQGDGSTAEARGQSSDPAARAALEALRAAFAGDLGAWPVPRALTTAHAQDKDGCDHSARPHQAAGDDDVPALRALRPSPQASPNCLRSQAWHRARLARAPPCTGATMHQMGRAGGHRAKVRACFPGCSARPSRRAPGAEGDHS